MSTCQVCFREISLTVAGNIRDHGFSWRGRRARPPCSGSEQPPLETAREALRSHIEGLRREVNRFPTLRLILALGDAQKRLERWEPQA
jgi:hypothetical protein